jgi:hypothetical protein
MCEGVRWCRDMHVGRGDGSTDDADVCGISTVRRTRPEVESMRVYICGYGCWRGMYICTHRLWKASIPHSDARSIHHAGRFIKRTITHAGGAVWLVRYH